jgi:hypothetical protein
MHIPAEPGLPAIWCSTAPMASSGASCRFYFGPEECDEVLMLEEPDAPAIAELYRKATQKLND